MSISLNKNELTVDGFVTRDPHVIAAFAQEQDEGANLDEYIEQVLHVGVQVLGVASASIGVERLASGIDSAEKSMTTAAKALGESLTKQIADLTGDDGKLSSLVETVMKDFSEDIQKLTAGESSPIREAIKKQMDELNTRITDNLRGESSRQKDEIAKLLDPANASSPLRQITMQLEQVSTGLREVKNEISKEVAVAEIIDNSTHGGVPYEDAVVAVVQRISVLAGDDCEATGDKVGLVPRRKSGDGVVSLKFGDAVKARIVLEAKNSALDLREWQKEIKDSKENRGAEGFIGFAKQMDYLPNGGRVMIIDRQTMLVAFDPSVDDAQIVALVYQMVKMSTLALSGSVDEDVVRIVNDNLDQSIAELKKFDQLKKDVKQMENLSRGVHETLVALHEGIRTRLESIQAAVSPSLPALENSRDESPALEAGSDGA